jgi:hypothetical protein
MRRVALLLLAVAVLMSACGDAARISPVSSPPEPSPEVAAPGTIARVKILDDEGRPLAKAWVWCGESEAETDATGVAVLIDLDPRGEETLRISPPARRHDLADASVDSWHPWDETIRLERPLAIAGVVRDEDGSAAASSRLDTLPPVVIDLYGWPDDPAVWID